MSENTSNRWIKPVLITALLWNILGILAFVMQLFLSPEMISKLPEEQQLAYNSQPLWATLAFAIAVFGGALGCVLLLFKKSLARLTLIISLAAVLAQQYYNFMIINSINLFGISAIFMPIAVTKIAIALVYLSFHLKQQDYFK